MIKIPVNWTQAEVNEYFNIRLDTIEKHLSNSIIGFIDCIPEEDSIINSTQLRESTKQDMLKTLTEIKDKYKKK